MAFDLTQKRGFLIEAQKVADSFKALRLASSELIQKWNARSYLADFTQGDIDATEFNDLQKSELDAVITSLMAFETFMGTSDAVPVGPHDNNLAAIQE